VHLRTDRKQQEDEFRNPFKCYNINKGGEDGMSGVRTNMKEERNAYKVLVRKLKERVHSEYIPVYGIIILKWVWFNK
jgi:hypothetical protein